MAQVLVVRHALGSREQGLSPLGWEQSRRLGAAMAARGVVPTLVVHGGARPERETAEAAYEAAGWAAEMVADPDWMEFDQFAVMDRLPAPFGGRIPSRDEFQSWLDEATQRWFSGEHDADYTEPYAGFAARVDRAVRRVTELVGEDGTAVVFTSAGPVARVAAALLTDSADDGACRRAWARLGSVVVNSSVTKVVAGGRGPALMTFNDHAHLEAVVPA
jgi:broad specificity phosphatase PhoE